MKKVGLSLRRYQDEYWTIYDDDLLLVMFARDAHYKLVLCVFIAMAEYYEAV